MRHDPGGSTHEQQNLEVAARRANVNERSGTMKKFGLGIIVGVMLTGSLGLAGNLYDRQGNPAGPPGSIQEFDYFRQRQQQLDIGAMRRQQEQDRLNRAGRPPCP